MWTYFEIVTTYYMFLYANQKNEQNKKIITACAHVQNPTIKAWQDQATTLQ